MKRYWYLLGALLRVNFSLGKLRHTLHKNPGELFRAVAVALLVAIAVVPLLWVMMNLEQVFHEVLKLAGQSYLIVTLTLLVAQLLIFFFGIFYLLSAFYLTRDRDQLLSLPLRPIQVLGAKFTVVMVNEYLSSLPLVLPILVYFGLLERTGAGYWFNLTIVLLLLPLLPLALAALLVVLLMRFVNLGRHKDKLIVAGSLLLMGLSVLLQTKLAGGNRSGSELIRTLTAREGLLRWLGAKFPPALWATRMLEHAGSHAYWLPTLLFVGSALAVAGLFLLAGRRLYYSGLIGLAEAGSGAKPQGKLALGSGHSPRRAILWREWQVMNRTPIFLLNGTLSVLFVPLIFGLMLNFNADLRQHGLFSFLLSSYRHPAILATAFFLILCGSMNGTSSSAFSREGRQFWFSKVIPVTPQWQVTAKFLHAMLLALVGLVAGSISLRITMHTPLGILLPGFLLALPATMAFSVAGLTIDLLHPKLGWTNPQRAIKQNLNVFLHLLFQMATLATLGILFTWLRQHQVDGALILTGFAGIFLVLFAAGGLLLRSLAERRYAEIEA